MGYDCTLHLIDPASIERFVSWFLREPVDATAFERAFDTQGLRDEVLAKLDESAHSGGRALLHALLMFCSAEAPHQYSKGFCLGLWNKLDLGLADELPASLVSSDSLAPRLARIVERYPAFEHSLYTGIDGNYAVGHFVPPEDVGAVREHVESILDQVESDWLESVEALLYVLDTAERRGLAYWEATDLDVANANAEWFTSAAPSEEGSSVSRVETYAQVLQFSCEIDGVVLAGSLSDGVTWLFDARADALDLRVIDGIALESFARAPSGEIYAVGFVPGRGPVLAKLSLDRQYAIIDTPAGLDLRKVARVGERVLVVANDKSDLVLLWIDDPTPIRLANARAWGASVFDLGDGSALVNADGRSVRLRDRSIEPLPAMPPLSVLTFGGHQPTVVTRDGQQLFSACEVLPPAEQKARRDDPPLPRLVLLSPDGTCRDAFSALTSAQSAWPAKDGAALVFQHNPIERDLLKVYWHDRGEVASIPHSLVGEKRGHCQSAIYCAARDELWVSFNSHVVRVPWSVIEALPRQSVEQYTAAKNARVAEHERVEHERLWSAVRAYEFARRVDDPTAYFHKDSIVDHPERGRAIVRAVDYETASFTIEFEDRSRLVCKLPDRPTS